MNRTINVKFLLISFEFVFYSGLNEQTASYITVCLD